ANDTLTLQLYGWSASGPGSHMGTISLIAGNFTSAASTGFHASASTHKSIRDELLPATAYRFCDTYTITADYEREMITGVSGSTPAADYHEFHKSLSSPVTSTNTVPPVADFPSYVNVDLSRSRYEYFGIHGSAASGFVNHGAIWIPLSRRKF
ncbi:hypothetical protein LCGC14_3083310, partial [marine sediment metagenome]